MHLIKAHTGVDMITAASMRPPFGPGFSSEQIDGADVLEIWASDIKDSGEDFCKFILKTKTGGKIAEKTVNGY